MAESTSVVIYDPRQAGPEVVALAGFLAGYSGRTREAYTLDLRQFFTWCGRRGVRLFDLHRAEIELFARELEELGRAACAPWLASTATPRRKGSSSTPRLCTFAGPAWTTSPTPWAWTATSWVPSWLPPVSLRLGITPWRACSL